MINPQRLAIIRVALNQLLLELRAYLQHKRLVAQPGSQFEKELTANPGSTYLTQAVSSVFRNLEFGGDHLFLFIKSITHPILPTASLTCVRSMLETCALASWLIDVRIDATARINRMAALDYDGDKEFYKYMAASKVDQSDLDQIKQIIDDSIRDASSQGIPVINNNKGKMHTLGMQKPSATDLIASELDEEQFYRLLSGVAHGHFWANDHLAYEPNPNAPKLVLGGNQMIASRKTISEEVVNRLAASAVHALALPTWSQCLYHGWDAEPLAAIFERVSAHLPGLEGRRFWRPQA